MRYFTKELKTKLSDQATLTCYLLDNYKEFDENRQRPAIILCPGGGYCFRSDREAEPLAIRMLSLGLQAFVLNYSIAPARFPISLTELAEAVKYVRDNSKEFNINSQQIVISGMSAGGHLAASLGVFWNSDLLKKYGFVAEEIKPNAMLLGYSVLTSGVYTHEDSIKNLLGKDANDSAKRREVDLVNHVSKDTPPTFLWHTVTDDVVPCQSSILFAEKLKENDVNFELHLYPAGGHGLSLGNKEIAFENGYGIQTEIQNWPEIFSHWLKLIFDK